MADAAVSTAATCRTLAAMTNANVSFSVNGTATRAATDGDRSLLAYLRDELGLTGAKPACGEGVCGACTVLVDGSPVRSCVTQLTAVDARSVTTIESLPRDGALHPVQAAFRAEGAFQCG